MPANPGVAPACQECGQYLATVAGRTVCPDCDEDWIEDQLPRCEHDEDRACPSAEPCKRGECIRTQRAVEDEARWAALESP